MTQITKPNGTGPTPVADLDRFFLQRLKAGDEKAFQHIFLRLKIPLFHFIRKMVGSAEDAEDICQETFTTLWLKRESVDENGKVKSFLFGIAKHIVWNYMRKHQRQAVIFEEAGFDIDAGLTPDILMQLKETELLTEYAISKLPARTREIYKLHFYENFSNEKIAGYLDSTPENVRTHIHIARKSIRDIIAMVIATGFFAH